MRARVLPIARTISIALIGVLILRIAWMSDDALITLRTVLNITHDWGPGFNATESVQAFTHPLWFVVWVLTGTLTGNFVVAMLLLSALLATVAFGVLAWNTRTVPRLVVLTGLLALVARHPFWQAG